MVRYSFGFSVPSQSITCKHFGPWAMFFTMTLHKGFMKNNIGLFSQVTSGKVPPQLPHHQPLLDPTALSFILPIPFFSSPSLPSLPVEFKEVAKINIHTNTKV